jgi:hypothetical protein
MFPLTVDFIVETIFVSGLPIIVRIKVKVEHLINFSFDLADQHESITHIRLLHTKKIRKRISFIISEKLNAEKVGKIIGN